VKTKLEVGPQDTTGGTLIRLLSHELDVGGSVRSSQMLGVEAGDTRNNGDGGIYVGGTRAVRIMTCER